MNNYNSYSNTQNNKLINQLKNLRFTTRLYRIFVPIIKRT